MKNQIEWVKKGLRLCTNPIQFEEEEKRNSLRNWKRNTTVFPQESVKISGKL